MLFFIFPVHGQKWPELAPNRPGGFFLTNPDLADVVGRTNLNSGIFYFYVYFVDPTFLDWNIIFRVLGLLDPCDIATDV